MESRWRSNVFKLGMAFSDWKFAARLDLDLLPAEFYLVSFKDRPSGYVEVWRYYPDFPELLPELYLGPYYTPGGRFPLDYDVETDRP